MIPTSSLNLTSSGGFRTATATTAGGNIIHLPNNINLQTIPIQNIPGIGNVQLIPVTALNGNPTGNAGQQAQQIAAAQQQQQQQQPTYIHQLQQVS